MKKFIAVVSILSAATSLAQQKSELRSTITYVSATTIYIDAGRADNVAAGDTIRVLKRGNTIGTLTVWAVADSSSAAHFQPGEHLYSPGDTVTISVTLPEEKNVETSASGVASTQNQRASLRTVTSMSEKGSRKKNILTGRVAAQYTGIFAEDRRLNLNQPSVMLRLGVRNLFGEGMSLSIYDQGYFSSQDNYSLYASKSGFQQNLYDFSLTRDNESSTIGFGVGRLNSRFVGGLGTFDGAQIFFNISNFTTGILGGAAANIPLSVLSFGGTKTAAFVNYHTGADVLHRYDGTIAYGLQMVGGKLDRNFVYLQNSLSLGSRLMLYESSEIDLSELSNGERKPAFNFSNTYFSINYFPTDWLFANFGYDASREIYLFQTMKTIPDSLIDRSILQGFRGSVSVDLPGSITVSANGALRTRPGYARNEFNAGASFRASDIFGSGMNAVLRYTNLRGVFTKGGDFSAEIDRTFFYTLSLALGYESYNISVSTVQQTYSTQTLSGNIYYYISPKWYGSLGVDDIIDATMNSVQLSAEIGFRF